MNVLPLLCTTLALGALVLVTGLRTASPTADALQAGTSAVETGVGFALVALAALGFLTRRTLARVPDTRLDGSARALFVVSFVALFVELMLIRYLGSQFRILSFYKNIALVGAFLGLGVGAALGRAGPREVQRFALWMVPIAGLLGGGSLWLDDSISVLAARVSEEHILGDIASKSQQQWPGQLGMGVFCAAVFMLVAGQFRTVGRLLGSAFEGLPRRRAYTVNLAGSLAGVLAFLALCRVETPPAVWFVVGLAPLVLLVHDRTSRVVVAIGALLSAALVAPSVGHTVWSAYQKLVVTSEPWGTVDPEHPAQLVRISDVFYQVALDLRPEANARRGFNPYPHYDEAYAALPTVPDRVLVVGAGTGNDVAAALRAGVREVVAVDIDPAIVRVGKALHPEQPYADPRVRVVVEDARRVLRTSESDSYGAVIFGLLDSHTQLAGSSVRLDNYVFTQESLRDAWRVLRPGGSVVLTAACFDPWFVDRFDQMLRGAFGTDQVVAHPPEDGVWWQWTATKAAGALPGTIVSELPSDDWPFLYLPERSIPRAYLVSIGALVLASLAFVRASRLERGRLDAYHGHMFFLGAAFLLMETYAVNRLALLFGTTWIVSAVTIVLALVLVLVANLVSEKLASVPVALIYVGIAAGVVGTSLVAPTALVGSGPAQLLYGLLVLSPVFFAGLIFSRSFARAPSAGAALGANIVGSVLGGWTEYATMALGIQAMAWIALLFYACSALCLAAQRRPSTAGMDRWEDGPQSRGAVG